MNSFIVKAFVFINEVLSTIIIGLVLIVGVILMLSGELIAGLTISILGPLFFILLFGFAAIFIEIYKDAKAIRGVLERKTHRE
jgi:hypothetical protein